MKQRSLGEWLAYLEQLHPSAIDMGLERSQQVLARLALGKLAPRVVTVTGTNGKGSTCAFVASLLRAQGLKVGVYSSPHLLRYNERVLIDGLEASDGRLCEAFAAVEAARGDISLTYFEMGTLAAFWLFHQSQLDAVVLEVGLGGRLDTVNVVDADLALVTSIGVDHVDYLGDTREQVAFEKAGIFRPGKPALCGDLDPPQPLLDKAAELAAPLFLRGRDFDLASAENGWNWRGTAADGAPVELNGLPLLDLPMENAALALQAYLLMGLPWDAAQVRQALLDTRITGRLDRRQLVWQGRPVELLLDVGHNPHAAQYLARRLASRPLKGRRLAVFGLLADKDLAGVVAPLHGLIDDWAVAPLDTPRSRPAAELADALTNLGAAVKSYAGVDAALEGQCAQATADDQIVLFGSFFCVAQALAWLERHAQEG
ncbi:MULTISPECIES: bifunctional tetrahydrofolate synthase/dihydrofolate synthase [Pseudomonas]|jgi:dihydrofolate synthase/folylpolyglutamate synthase|uniref:Dihydrofolate synthase/folylpolyglutamate synthase n=1 Tax=Pseudomonas juntendi TaxID=2666183 RepID=A0ABD4YAQ6_9PSED|nr:MULTISPECIES: bifunctional tetrahydrofolate synthase/dihydrofolate synthase [Pseudomonas]KLJ13895.1 folylpolyglutamate synthase [Pseudomonas sp. TJI-51]MBA6124208.1 bifunctional tetrahydrofolate synthase/dihydrofolate synthase [Pseudomonas juntendi]MBI6916497.1 bifunctional tetrahydrofolate synthase/dihydrofolate synthase [Pseudomonas juntendi]MCF3159425.1 bifunctional tetrahydrofolate synthase/dihydrofolate synthase [Pseudomonas juntendi]MCQ1993157.1 bifunctional tetrahydrofolate synthase/